MIQRDERRVSDEDVSKVFETPSEVVSAGIEILDGVIENLSKERDERRREPVGEGGVGDSVTLRDFDKPFEECLNRAV